MSKKSQREAREKKEQLENERRSNALGILRTYLKIFVASFPPRDGVDEQARAAGFELGLADLSPEDMEIACQQTLQKHTFWPAVAEIRGCLREWKERQPRGGTQVVDDCSLCHGTHWKPIERNGNTYLTKCHCPPEARREYHEVTGEERKQQIRDWKLVEANLQAGAQNLSMPTMKREPGID